MRLVLPVLMLAACSPLGEKPEAEPDADWPTILEAEPTDPAPLLAAEHERPYERITREATDLWVGNDRSLRAEITPLADMLEQDGVLAGWGTGGGSAMFDLAVTEADFDALVAEQGWDIPPYVGLTFVHPLQISAMSLAASEYVRFMPVEPQRTVFQLEALGQGRIFLENGCLWVGEPNGIRRLAFFHAETGVDVRDGELVLVDRTTTRTRGKVGEQFSWGAPNPFNEEWDAAKKLREACGDADVTNVGNPEATTLFEARYPGAAQERPNPTPPLAEN
ncbi:hypothetical protein [Sphingomicrobium clamense]|uniref:Uncharacterized protein n=1 Tax=Sphingomicrobium clamense TaxID=2851013 RepID=A0ABS6V8I4_9SPHN|nr:hypothetical protein [Sphingomicrobium sp. B8]MBW0145811.1 hypothetical protein [Sphingomicrobium sp. B8]